MKGLLFYAFQVCNDPEFEQKKRHTSENVSCFVFGSREAPSKNECFRLCARAADELMHFCLDAVFLHTNFI